MELLPVSNTSNFFTWSSENVDHFMDYFDEGNDFYLDDLGGNKTHPISGMENMQTYIIRTPLLPIKQNISYEMEKGLQLQCFPNSESTTLMLGFLKISPTERDADDFEPIQFKNDKPDPKFSRYIMPIQMPENAGMMLGNTDVTMTEGNWYEIPFEKPRYPYNFNEDNEDVILLVHDIIKTKTANKSEVKSYLEFLRDEMYGEEVVSNGERTDFDELLDEGAIVNDPDQPDDWHRTMNPPPPEWNEKE